MKCLSRIWLISVILLAASPALSEETELLDLNGSNYFPVVHSELQSATQSIYVAMYQMRVYNNGKASSPTLALVKDLVAAHQRGVRVEVFLDQSFRYSPSSRSSTLDTKNDRASEYLSFSGVPLSFAKAGHTLHQKLIVIDERTVINGSHNWSDRALMHNFENSDLIRDREHARNKLENFRALREQYPLIRETNSIAGLDIPESFLTRKDLASQMVSESDNRAFDCYCNLLKQARVSTNGMLIVSLDALASDLGLAEEMDRTAYRRQLIKVLRKMQDRYKLLTCDFQHAKPALVKMIPLASEGGITIPDVFWSYGYHRKLSLSAKMAYFICIYEHQRGLLPPYWSLSHIALGEKYHLDRETIRQGLLELEKFDILQITRSISPPNKSFDQRHPNVYRLRPLLSDAEIAVRWSELESVYDAETLTLAKEIGSSIGHPNSHRTARDIAGIIKKYGPKATTRAGARVAAMTRDNPFRHPGYIVALIKKEL
jgi:hypothetical protein